MGSGWTRYLCRRAARTNCASCRCSRAASERGDYCSRGCRHAQPLAVTVVEHRVSRQHATSPMSSASPSRSTFRTPTKRARPPTRIRNTCPSVQVGEGRPGVLQQRMPRNVGRGQLRRRRLVLLRTPPTSREAPGPARKNRTHWLCAVGVVRGRSRGLEEATRSHLVLLGRRRQSRARGRLCEPASQLWHEHVRQEERWRPKRWSKESMC